MTPSDVLCSFCGCTVQNPEGWAVCKTCWDDGTYGAWVTAELRRPELTAERRRELARAKRIVHGVTLAPRPTTPQGER